MTTYVLVHGAWHGAWCWRRVTRMLTAHDHEVFTPTLTGVGERSHLLTPEIDLDTHITDVVNVMKWERLDQIVLVGHSYGGLVVSGVAEQRKDAIAAIVLLDAFYPDNGQSLADQATKMTRDAIEAAVQKRDTVLAPRPAAMFKVNEKDCAWVDALCVPHPIRCFTQKNSPHRCERPYRAQDVHPCRRLSERRLRRGARQGEGQWLANTRRGLRSQRHG